MVRQGLESPHLQPKMIIKREMKLSTTFTIEDILDLIKQDILSVQKTKSYSANSVFIKVRVFS